MKNLEKIAEILQNDKKKRARLYLLTRELKDGIKKTSRIPDKYNYKTWNIETDSDIQNALFDVFNNKVINISNGDKFSVTNYSIVSDDEESNIFTYTNKEKITSFIHVVDTDLKQASTLDSVIDLETLEDNLWAYIIEVYTDNKIICGLRKTSKNKIMHERKGFTTIFNTKNKTLSLVKERSILFDNNLDALYFNNIFYIIQKHNFEEIVGLQEEYRDEARVVADKIEKSPKISLDFDLQKTIEEKLSFIRKLAKIKDEIDKIDDIRISKMKNIAKKFKLNFITDKDGKIHIKDENDLDVVIKLLDDYYLESNQTGKKYGASVKKEM